MTLPILLRHDMQGAPQLTNAAGSLISVLTAALVNGFNTQSVVSATASGGVVTLNFATAPGFSALDSVTVAGSAVAAINGLKRVQSAGSNQVLVAVPGVADGAVGGTMTLKFAPLGWTRPFTGTNLAAYRVGGGISQRFLRVADLNPTANSFCELRGYETMTGISAGAGLFPASAQIAGNGVQYPRASSAGVNNPWLIVGDEKRFYLVTDYGQAAFSGGQAPDAIAFFGQLANVIKPADAFAVMLVSHNFPNAAYLPRTSASTGTACPVEIRGLGFSAYFGASGVGLNPADAGVLFMQSGVVAEIGSPYAVRGLLPGALEPQSSTHDRINGTVISNITGVTGRLLLVKQSVNSTAIALLLDEDWM